MKTKICKGMHGCGFEKPMSEFRPWVSKRDGRTYYTAYCKDCCNLNSQRQRVVIPFAYASFAHYPVKAGTGKPTITGMFGDWIKSSRTAQEVRI